MSKPAYPFSWLPTATCYSDRGRFYQGDVNVTSSGTPCQHWNQQVIRFLLRDCKSELGLLVRFCSGETITLL